jgi:hypothetical protein
VSDFLTPAELVELTDKQTAPAQARRLKALGIPHFWVKGARPKVPRSALTGARSAGPTPANEPDFSVFVRGR